ncbi:hypothetical protein ACU4GD_30605 [Cupriavidus basilensis]
MDGSILAHGPLSAAWFATLPPTPMRRRRGWPAKVFHGPLTVHGPLVVQGNVQVNGPVNIDQGAKRGRQHRRRWPRRESGWRGR